MQNGFKSVFLSSTYFLYVFFTAKVMPSQSCTLELFLNHSLEAKNMEQCAKIKYSTGMNLQLQEEKNDVIGKPV